VKSHCAISASTEGELWKARRLARWLSGSTPRPWVLEITVIPHPPVFHRRRATDSPAAQPQQRLFRLPELRPQGIHRCLSNGAAGAMFSGAVTSARGMLGP
jgi:hypothetical protein